MWPIFFNCWGFLDKELTVHETVTDIIGGQTFSYSLCKSKNVCQTLRYASLKKIFGQWLLL